MTFRLLAGSVALALAVGCTSGDAVQHSPQDAGSGSGGLTLLVMQAPEAPGALCEYGGTLVSAGLDTDHDGTLDPEEVAKAEPVCDAAPGTPPPVVTRTALEAAGENCPTGGTRIDAGRDLSGDGLLGDDEVERTTYACATPVPEAPAVLTRVDFEPFGSNCAAGGSAVRFGPDTDGSGALDDAEVAGVQYVCETRAIPGFTVRSRADADLVSAASIVEGYLNIQITEPIDLDISPTAVTGGIVVNSSALTGLGLYCWLVGDYVRVEGNPKLKRFWLSAETLGGDVIVRDNPELDSVVLPSGKGFYDLSPYRYPGHLLIARNAKLVALALFNPVEVGGNLVIESNPALKYLFFDGLTRVGGDLVLADNDAMEEIPSLVVPPLQSVGGLLDIRDNAKLSRVTLQELQAAGGLRLARNALLSSPWFPELVAVLGSVYIEDNPVLGLSIYPVGKLQVVTGWFSVERNAILSSLGEFGNVSEIGETLSVANNPRLRDLAFERLVRAGGVAISDNPLLETIGPSPTPGDPSTNSPSLTRLETTARISVARNVALRQLVLPALKYVSSMSAQDNPLLPSCQAASIPAYYHSISGNDDTATCP